jgi:hypothetical protein
VVLTLDPGEELGRGGGLFVLFRDATSGVTTYAAVAIEAGEQIPYERR